MAFDVTVYERAILRVTVHLPIAFIIKVMTVSSIFC